MKFWLMITTPFFAAPSFGTPNASRPKGDAVIEKLKIQVGERKFTATLLDNETVTAFKTLLPLTLEMPDLNNYEKHVDLSKNLPTESSNPKNIDVGDLMIYGSNTLVLFNTSFPTSYSYTKLGKIDDVSDFATAIGSAIVTFKIE